jgi:hypothetical protein
LLPVLIVPVWVLVLLMGLLGPAGSEASAVVSSAVVA